MMQRFLMAATICGIGVTGLAPVASADHWELDIDCELMSGGPSACCDAISDSAGAAPITYHWWDDPRMGWFESRLTSKNWTIFHCGNRKVGVPQLYNSVDDGVVMGHGRAIGRCGSEL